MIVLSLFDGMGCGLEALKRAGLPVTKYYASEVDKYSIKVAKSNHPEIIHLGDVNNWRDWNIEKPDLIMGGSPCQGFSFAGKQLAFSDPRSQLFFVMMAIIDHYKPNYRFLENVRMKKDFLNIITDFMGLEPQLINSALVSAQNRHRYYWYNWDAPEPEDRGILLKDIVHENAMVDRDKSRAIIGSIGRTTPREYFEKNQGQMVYEIPTFNTHPSGRGANGVVTPLTKKKSKTVTTNKGEGHKTAIPLNEYIVPFDKSLKILDKEVAKGKIGYFGKDNQSNRVYYIHDKAITLCGNGGGGCVNMGQYFFGSTYQVPRGKNKGGFKEQPDKHASLTSQSFDQNNYILGCLTPDRINKRQNGQRFNNGQKFYTLTPRDQHGILLEGYIRKLTPMECEILQTLKMGYTEGVSNTQRYKMLGNGWTVEVIAHILRYMFK